MLLTLSGWALLRNLKIGRSFDFRLTVTCFLDTLQEIYNMTKSTLSWIDTRPLWAIYGTGFAIRYYQSSDAINIIFLKKIYGPGNILTSSSRVFYAIPLRFEVFGFLRLQVTKLLSKLYSAFYFKLISNSRCSLLMFYSLFLLIKYTYTIFLLKFSLTVYAFQHSSNR